MMMMMMTGWDGRWRLERTEDCGACPPPIWYYACFLQNILLQIFDISGKFVFGINEYFHLIFTAIWWREERRRKKRERRGEKGSERMEVSLFLSCLVLEFVVQGKNSCGENKEDFPFSLLAASLSSSITGWIGNYTSKTLPPPSSQPTRPFWTNAINWFGG